jgi:hypothetical protein
MSSKPPKHRPTRPPPTRNSSQVRPAAGGNERRGADRYSSDAEIEILSPIQGIASALDVSSTGIQLSLDDWLAAGTLCDLRITTHTGRALHKRARVIWTRRVGERCVSGLEVVGSITPHASDED